MAEPNQPCTHHESPSWTKVRLAELLTSPPLRLHLLPLLLLILPLLTQLLPAMPLPLMPQLPLLLLPPLLLLMNASTFPLDMMYSA